MPDIIPNCVMGVIACLCYGSFIWSTVKFFRQGEDLALPMKVICYTGMLGILVHLLGILFSTLDNPIRLALGFAGFVSSLIIFWWALRTHWKRKLAIAFSDDQPHAVVQNGPYRWVRHPIYLSYMLSWIAGAILIPDWWPWIFVLVMGIQYLRAIRYEEAQFLQGNLANDYRAYIDSTGVLFPNPLKAIQSRLELPTND